MRYDDKRIDETVLAVLYLNAFDDNGVSRAWKGINWECMNRLFESGMISYPRTTGKSVVFTQEGFARAMEAAERLFGLDGPESGLSATDAELSQQSPFLTPEAEDEMAF